jgi:serine/threonine protein kinase/Flp pilus assembly protein TadD
MNTIENKAKSIFLAAVESHGPELWSAYLDQACAGDQTLREQVEVLLRAHAGSDSLLDHSAPLALATIDEPITERPGTVIGPYKLMEQIGEGGMGLIFVAEQQQPVRRKVALKVIKPGMDTRQVIARFEAERQALALMDHPNIAKVFDGGETVSRRPYFVMELVKGVPITEYCDQNQVPIRKRLELFRDVCQAVQHAHQKGIIHRDIKPTNVLVMSDDGTPLVKVIDFGVAKAIGLQLTEKTVYTHFTQLVGTPLYMSPEQAGKSGRDVDTRTDIYALGVMLYELLTGTTPFDGQRLKEADLDEIRRIIREEEPPKPSTRISTLGQAATTVSTQRKSDPKRLSQLCRGEVDWIVMRCLEKDRNRRYETASALASDIQRYLDDEPVQACPPSAWYRFRKFVRRRRGVLTTAGLVLFLLVALGVGAGWMVRDQSARVALTDERADSAINDAAALQAKWKWSEALEAVKRAEGILAGGSSEELRARARETRKDLEMVLRLEEIRFQTNGRGQEGREEAVRDGLYVQAFQDFGIDVDALDPGEAAARVRDHPIWLQLTAALDCWADDRLNGNAAKDASWKRLFAVARAADPDPWRNQVRAAVEQGDKKTLGQLAASANVRELPPPSLSLLVHRGHLDLKLEQSLLRQAQREHPEDAMLNFQIAWAADPEERVRFATAAVVARPRHAYTRFCLANALWSHNKRDEAIAEYNKVFELNPEFAMAYNHLGWLLATCAEPRSRDPKRALELAKKAVDLDPKQSAYWNTLGVARYRTHAWEETIANLNKAEELAPGKYFAWNAFFLAMAHWQLGEKELARKEYEQAIEWMEKHQRQDEDLQRFRAEAETLLGIKPGDRGGVNEQVPN